MHRHGRVRESKGVIISAKTAIAAACDSGMTVTVAEAKGAPNAPLHKARSSLPTLPLPLISP
jgi:hypothetical protein